jgi:hypothetical protein
MSTEETDLSPLQKQEEQKKWALKCFDYAEDPIKEWIAAQLDETVETLFDDYSEESDILSIEVDKAHYTFYLTCYPTDLRNDTAFHIDKEYFLSHPKLQKAASILFDAVYMVFPPVVKTMTNMGHRIEDVFPDFEEKNMCFRFRMVNKFEMLKRQALQTLEQIRENFAKIEGKTDEQFTEIREKLTTLQKEQLDKLNSLGEAVIAEQEAKCQLQNETFRLGKRLYIAVEKNMKQQDDDIMKRLPDFGLKYQDPEEETAIEAYKKELGM